MVFKKGMIPHNKADLLNKRFGKLLVVKGLYSRKQKSMWLCKCDCGNTTEVETYRLKSGHTSSCGCYKIEKGFQKGKDHINWKGGFSRLNVSLPLYDTYVDRLLYCEILRKKDNGLLEAKCAYCGKFFVPTLYDVSHRLAALNGGSGESRFYCSDGCKKACPVFNKILWPRGFKPATSREVQPELRQMVLERDDWACQRCGETEAELHCHHITGIKQNPIESADADNCVTFCKKCHKWIHQQGGCKYHELRCKEL